MTQPPSLEREGVVAARLRLLREPALPILLLALVAMVRRGYVLDMVLVGGAALLVLADAGRWAPVTASAEPGPEGRGRPVLVVLAIVAAAMTPLPRMSHRLDVAFTLVGVVVLAAVWRPGPGPTADADQPAPPRWWLWPTLGVGVCLVELSTLFYQPAPRVDSVDHPSISTVVEPLLNAWPSRGLALWLWLLGGWWLVRRVRAWAR